VQRDKFVSKLLGNERRIWIYTPHGHSADQKPYGLLVLTDGGNNTSWLSAQSVIDAAIRHETVIYPVAVDRQSPQHLSERPPIAEDDGLRLLATIAERTGGRVIHANWSKDLGLVFDALVLPRHLPRLRTLIDRHPDLAVVIDHGAKPQVREGLREPWASDLAAIAAVPAVTCKLSGLVTEAAPEWRVADVRPYAEHILATFGSQRVLFGSDWPVVNLAGGYDRWREAALDLIQDFSVSDRAAILGDTARRVYLSRRGRS